MNTLAALCISRVLTLITLAFLFLLAPAASQVMAQQVTGTPGSPDATTTITGKQLPAPVFECVLIR
jgi:arylsulfatase